MMLTPYRRADPGAWAQVRAAGDLPGTLKEITSVDAYSLDKVVKIL